IPAMEHDWDEGVVTTEPTCEEVGTKTYTCHRCEATQTEEIPSTGHNFEWVVDKEATYEEAGVQHEECTVCHAKRNENTEIPVIVCEHKDVTVYEEVAADCTTAGHKAYTKCNDCGKVIDGADEEIPAMEHDWDEGVVTTEPTETEKGIKTYTCNRCKETKTEEIPVLALGTLVITADKTKVKPGDTIQYTVTMGPIKNLDGVEFQMAIPEGLTYDLNSGAILDNPKEVFNNTNVQAAFYEEEIRVIIGSIGGYTSKEDIILFTFSCTVDDDYTGTAVMDFVYDEDFIFDNTAQQEIKMTVTTASVVISNDETPELFTVSGTVTSYYTESAPDAPVNITIYDEEGHVVGTVYEVLADATTYTINLNAGTYKMQVSKENHVTRTYEIVVTDHDIELNVKICPIGDMNLDGKVDVRDYNMLFRCASGESEIPDDPYAKACADVNDDGALDVRDYNAIFYHVAGTKSLW
ncbi:MAG: dockerin type I domain-containing protein, partial [Eubacteriales bacterium]